MRFRLLAALIVVALSSVSGLALAQTKQPPLAPTPASNPPQAPANTSEPSETRAAPEAAPAPGATHATEAEHAGQEQPKPGDAAAGATKSAACAACHGLDGNSADAQYPKLAGQHERYIQRQLELFKAGERENAVMQPFAAALSAQDMRDIGAYFATKTALPGVADDSAIKADAPETWVQRGQTLYRGGNRDSGLPACMACHGPSGRGNPGPSYPELGGQHAKYTKDMLTRFRAGTVLGKAERASPIMAQVAASLSDDDINALASYIEGLHRTTETDRAPIAAPAAGPAPAAAASTAAPEAPPTTPPPASH